MLRRGTGRYLGPAVDDRRHSPYKVIDLVILKLGRECLESTVREECDTMSTACEQ